jgi:hypothetical protein
MSNHLDTTLSAQLTTVMAPSRNILKNLLDIKTGDLDTHVTAARNNGQSWRTIATNLTQTTGINVSHETLRSWYRTRKTTECTQPSQSSSSPQP